MPSSVSALKGFEFAAAALSAAARAARPFLQRDRAVGLCCLVSGLGFCGANLLLFPCPLCVGEGGGGGLRSYLDLSKLPRNTLYMSNFEVKDCYYQHLEGLLIILLLRILHGLIIPSYHEFPRYEVFIMSCTIFRVHRCEGWGLRHGHKPVETSAG